MSYLNCSHCPSQSYPTGREHLWLMGLRVAVPLIEYKCLSGHVHYVITEHKEDVYENTGKKLTAEDMEEPK